MRPRLFWPSLMTALMVGFLLGLGTWQLQRKAWKDGLVAMIEARRVAEPLPLPDALALKASPGALSYRRVKVTGRFRHDLERFFFAPDPQLGPGLHVYTPLIAAGSATVVWVNRGFIPEHKRDPATRAAGAIEGTVSVVGLTRELAAKPTFAPVNDAAHNLWFWRDVTGLTASAFPAGAAQPVAPFVLDAELGPVNPGGWPRGGTTIIDLPNRHLEYALTWFALAVTLAGIYGVYAWGSRAQ